MPPRCPRGWTSRRRWRAAAQSSSDDLTDEERRRPRDVVPVREERPVPRVRLSLGADPAHGEDHLLRPSREQVPAARASVDEQAGSVRVAALDLLAVAGSRAGHQRAGLLLDPAEGGNVVVRAEQDARLARARLRREVGLPLDEPVRARREPAGHLRSVSVAERPLQHGKGEAVDLDEDDARPVGAYLLARPSGHPLDHAQRVRVVVVDPERDLEDERGGGRDESARERPAEVVHGDGVLDRVARRSRAPRRRGRGRRRNPLRTVNGSRIRAMAGTISAFRMPTTAATPNAPTMPSSRSPGRSTAAARSPAVASVQPASRVRTPQPWTADDPGGPRRPVR